MHTNEHGTPALLLAGSSCAPFGGHACWLVVPPPALLRCGRRPDPTTAARHRQTQRMHLNQYLLPASQFASLNAAARHVPVPLLLFWWLDADAAGITLLPRCRGRARGRASQRWRRPWFLAWHLSPPDMGIACCSKPAHARPAAQHRASASRPRVRPSRKVAPRARSTTDALEGQAGMDLPGHPSAVRLHMHAPERCRLAV